MVDLQSSTRGFWQEDITLATPKLIDYVTIATRE